MTNTTAVTRAIEAELAAAHVTKNQLADSLGIARSNLLRNESAKVGNDYAVVLQEQTFDMSS